jgi:hypothetical protein
MRRNMTVPPSRNTDAEDQHNLCRGCAAIDPGRKPSGVTRRLSAPSLITYNWDQHYAYSDFVTVFQSDISVSIQFISGFR